MELGDWVIEEACRAAACWPEHITVAVNVSAKQLIFPALPNTVNEAIRTPPAAGQPARARGDRIGVHGRFAPTRSTC